MFRKLLIANRGEIACRVMQTARQLDIGTVAVYSEADADALHVEMADEAFLIGPPAAAESYLRGDAIIEAARACRADAIHPGYGFLAENAGFARACREAGVIFIGPEPETIEAMGDKAAAKALMEEAGVPVLPGEHGASQDDASLAAAAQRIGFPLMIKPVAGGGGIGMRVVTSKDDFAAALAAARREALSAFGDERVLLERYLERPRHIEVQIFGDTHGNIVHLFERDCSIQRRHQKVIEEAPAPGLAAEVRGGLLDAAVAAAQAATYVGAGTVEFLYEGGAFWFLEMNTRLQVEHPVTEMITDLDLVEWQLRVAAGEALPCEQEDIAAEGHAIEARVYAEDPARGFLPSTGRVYHFRAGTPDPDIRLDRGIGAGRVVSPHYDPMIAKLIVWGEDREDAIDGLRESLAELQIAGVATNTSFLAAVMAHPDYEAGDIDTGFVERHIAALAPTAAPAPDAVLALAAIDAVERRAAAAEAAGQRTGDPHSPWHRAEGWRLNSAARREFRLLDGEAERRISVTRSGDLYRVAIDGSTLEARAGWDEHGEHVLHIGGARVAGTVAAAEREMTVFVDGASWRLVDHAPLAMAADDGVADGQLTAPMPGRIASVMVEAGAEVARGAPLMVLEAMKMEHTISAPVDGRIERVNFAAGDLVDEGAELLAFAVGEGD